jgi:hypothetical protein
LLAQDEVLRNRGALIAAVKMDVVTLTDWDGTPRVVSGVFCGFEGAAGGFLSEKGWRR